MNKRPKNTISEWRQALKAAKEMDMEVRRDVNGTFYFTNKIDQQNIKTANAEVDNVASAHPAN